MFPTTTAETPAPAEMQGCQRKPLMLRNLLVNNVNSWGNVQYNYPLRLSDNETRTGSSIALRHIPDTPFASDCNIKDPLPEKLCGRDMVVAHESFKTTSGEYYTKPNPNKAMERADCAMNCRRIGFMTEVEKRLNAKTMMQPMMLSEMKDNFRGVDRSPAVPPDFTVLPPDPEYIFDVVASGRAEAPCIPETSGGVGRLLDPYVTTYKSFHKPFTAEDQFGIGAKDQLTLYSESNVPKVRGFGPRHKEIYAPLTATVRTPVFDKSYLKKEFHEVSNSYNPVNNIKGVFISETKKKYEVPFAKTVLASWDHGESFKLTNYPPNPYQTNIAPAMYCSEYCHISQGTPPYNVVDQINHNKLDKPHKPCKKRFSVSKDTFL